VFGLLFIFLLKFSLPSLNKALAFARRVLTGVFLFHMLLGALLCCPALVGDALSVHTVICHFNSQMGFWEEENDGC